MSSREPNTPRRDGDEIPVEPRRYPGWTEPPLPNPPVPPTPGGDRSIAGGNATLSGRSLVGPMHRVPILYGRCRLFPDLVMAKQASRSGMRYGKFRGVISEGPIQGLESWVGATASHFEVLETTNGSLSTPSANLAGTIGLAAFYAEMKNNRPWIPEGIWLGRLLFDPRLGAWGAGEYPDPTKCVYETNPALVAADVVTFPQYGEVSPALVNWSSVSAAANYFDELVGGEKRYTFNLWLTAGTSTEEWLDTLKLHCGLSWREDGGLWHLDYSAPTATVAATIDDGDIVADTTPSFTFGGGAGLADRPNRFRAEWIDPSSRWEVRTVEVRHPEVEAGAPIRDASVYRLHGFHSEAMALRALWRIAHEIWSEAELECVLTAEHINLVVGSRITCNIASLGLSGADFIVTRVSYDGDRVGISARRYDTDTWAAPGSSAGALPDDGFFATPADPTGVEWLPRTVQRQIPLDDGTVAEQSATGMEIRFDPLTNPYAARVLVRYRQANETGAEGITSVLVVDGGLGYTNGSAVTVTGAAGGSGFAGTITTDGSGTITGVTISDPGSGYDPSDAGLALAVAGGSTQIATLRPVFGALVADIWDDPAAIEIPFPPTGNAPSVGGKNVIQLPLSVGPWPEPLYAPSDLLLDFDERTIGGSTTWSVALRVQSVPALLSVGLAVQSDPGQEWSTTVTDYPAVRRELAGLAANRLPKSNGSRLADSKLSDDGSTLAYDGNAIYHEGNPPPAGDTFPAGAIVAYGGSTAPDGWLLCDGSLVSRTTYADLFAVLGTAHGAGDGSTTFGLPDLRDRFVRGKGASSAIGNTGGAATHLHAVGLSIGTSGTNARETGDTLTQDASPVSGHLTVDHYHSSSVSGDTGSASSLPPFLVEVFIIKASGTPSAATPHNTLASRDASGAHPASAVSFTPTGSISATTVQAAIEEVAAEAAGGGSAITVEESDGSPSVANVTELRFSGATVTDNGAGAVTVTVTAGGGATSPASALYLHSTFGGF